MGDTGGLWRNSKLYLLGKELIGVETTLHGDLQNLENCPLFILNELLEQAIQKEYYEDAAKLRDEIAKR